MSDPIIDAHVHLWDPSLLDYPWLSGSPLHRRFGGREFDTEATGVHQIVLVQADARADQSVEEVAWLAGQLDSSRLLGVVAHAPLEVGAQVRTRLDQLTDAGPVVGIRRLLEGEPRSFLRGREFNVGIAELTSRGLPFDVCIRPDQLEETIGLADRHPDQTFVLDHLGGPPVGDEDAIAQWQEHVSLLALRPRVHVKLSGLSRHLVHPATADAVRRSLATALSAFGPRRCMFGSDWPLVRVQSRYQAWLRLVEDALSPLSPPDRRWVLHDAARAVYTPRRGETDDARRDSKQGMRTSQQH